MEKAIKKAIEGGWRPKGLNHEGKFVSWIKQAATNRSKFYERYLLDPLFWQALGKAMGWLEIENIDVHVEGHFYRYDQYDVRGSWMGHWHRFIDHLAEGKSVDEFFTNLLK